MRERIVVVLDEPQDLVNVAGTIRGMMNMGLRRLRLVRPAEFDVRRIQGIAHGAAPVLDLVEHYESLEAALADAVHVVGATARHRTASYVWQHPREAAPELLELLHATDGGPLALVFGREDAGLPNEALDRCDRLLTIPTDPSRRSLNLAQAVLVIAYELWLAGSAAEQPLPRPQRTARPATNAELGSLFEAGAAALEAIDFYKTRNPPAMLRTLRAIARRAQLDEREAKLLRAIALEVLNVLDRRATRP